MTVDLVLVRFGGGGLPERGDQCRPAPTDGSLRGAGGQQTAA